MFTTQPTIEICRNTEYMEFFPAEERAAMVKQYGGDSALGERDGRVCRISVRRRVTQIPFGTR